MVDQPLRQAAGQYQFAVGHRDETVAEGVEPELRPARSSFFSTASKGIRGLLN